jgi:hypothetical protein
MLDLPKELKPFITNYKVNLVEARDNNLIFHNQNNKDLFSLLRIIYDDSTDRRVRREQIAQYESDRAIDKSVRMAVAATSRVNLKEYEKEADAIVCNLWDEVREEGKAEGKEEGIFETLFGLVKDGILTVSEAAKRANMTEASFTEHMEKFKA